MFPTIFSRIRAFIGRLFFSKKLFKITIYMKSGNVIKLRNLTEFNYTNTKVNWTYAYSVHHMLHIDIDQIEAIVQE